MENKVHVKVAEGRRVLHPRSFIPVPEAGIYVFKSDPYWRRRLLAGDIIEIGGSEPAAPISEGDNG